jgi:hypothetical protein
MHLEPADSGTDSYSASTEEAGVLDGIVDTFCRAMERNRCLKIGIA